MNILSKNAPLETSISNMEAILDNLQCKVTFASEKHPLANCYSLILPPSRLQIISTQMAKGHSLASKASALGEYIERLQTNNFFIDFHLPNRTYYPDQKVFEFGGKYLQLLFTCNL